MARPKLTNVEHGTHTMYARGCRCPLCKEKKAAYSRERRRRIRDAWFAENGPCVTCGSWEQLELDHIDRFTKDPKLHTENGAGSVWTWSRKRREAELAKCQALCFRCHRRKSVRERWPDGPQPLSHPSHYAYHKGCRCDPCATLKSEYMKAWRASRKKPGRTPRPLSHPSHYAYRKGCRCKPCVTLKSEYQKAWRASRKESSP